MRAVDMIIKNVPSGGFLSSLHHCAPKICLEHGQLRIDHACKHPTLHVDCKQREQKLESRAFQPALRGEAHAKRCAPCSDCLVLKYWSRVQVLAAPRWHARQCVVRSNVLDVAREQELTVKEQAFTITELYSAVEVFITSASAGVVHVVEVRTSLTPPVRARST